MGVCAFHLEHHQEAIANFTNLLATDGQYRKNAYLFLAISHKKRNSYEDALLVVHFLVFSSPMHYNTFPSTLMLSSFGPRSSQNCIDTTMHLRISTKAWRFSREISSLWSPRLIASELWISSAMLLGFTARFWKLDGMQRLCWKGRLGILKMERLNKPCQIWINSFIAILGTQSHIFSKD